MRFLFSVLISAAVLLVSGCGSTQLAEPYASDFSTSGPLGEDCFQVLIKMEPDTDSSSMYEKRQSAYIKARKNLYSEAEKQITAYCMSFRQEKISESEEAAIKKTAASYAESGKLEEEFYLIDDSVVLVYRIYKKGIKNEFLNK
ncbi:MAG TPA: hypothetical protein P5120_10280 [Spirochaetota bacterium]|nr:hypothetical protein [Spirochaetota bacterium]HPF05028.1 hypothetical protein [Spirochaetota bacterium]HPJ41195.1 hypothetical protein [Spirochaetota bacterium]HPR38460.1 hypothetical protein [Spirochaetota bacterium]HRX47896.1 hypothetical protein [Spirochaetota bacterium]